MRTDNWSLKGKGMKGYPDGERTLFYNPESIETLRQRLVEDIKQIDYDRIAKDNNYDLIDDLVKIVNKRFGKKGD